MSENQRASHQIDWKLIEPIGTFVFYSASCWLCTSNDGPSWTPGSAFPIRDHFKYPSPSSTSNPCTTCTSSLHRDPCMPRGRGPAGWRRRPRRWRGRRLGGSAFCFVCSGSWEISDFLVVFVDLLAEVLAVQMARRPEFI
jgi:hypothetical protein